MKDFQASLGRSDMAAALSMYGFQTTASGRFVLQMVSPVQGIESVEGVSKYTRSNSALNVTSPVCVFGPVAAASSESVYLTESRCGRIVESASQAK